MGWGKETETENEIQIKHCMSGKEQRHWEKRLRKLKRKERQKKMFPPDPSPSQCRLWGHSVRITRLVKPQRKDHEEAMSPSFERRKPTWSTSHTPGKVGASKLSVQGSTVNILGSASHTVCSNYSILLLESTSSHRKHASTIIKMQQRNMAVLSKTVFTKRHSRRDQQLPFT